MNNVRFLIALACVAGLSVQAQTLDPARVKKYEHECAITIKRKKVLSKAVYAALGASACYGAYAVYTFFTNKSVPLASGAAAPAGGYLERFGNWLTNSETWINIGQMACTGLVANKVQSNMQYALQPETMVWFTVHYAPYQYSFREMGWHLHVAMQNDAELTDKQYVALKQAYEKIVEYAERINGFMRWKAGQLTTQKAQEQARAVADDFFENITIRLQALETALHAKSDMLSFYLDTTFVALQHECQRFAQVEGSHWIDPNTLVAISHSLA